MAQCFVGDPLGDPGLTVILHASLRLWLGTVQASTDAEVFVRPTRVVFRETKT